ncbi:MAG: FkbM family methyltransferase [Bacteroidota bacterium]
MKELIKDTIRKSLNALHLDLTKNLKYDRLTKDVIAKSLNENSNAIDVGCHKGEILDLILKHAPAGKHFAFEPIPDFYNALKIKYAKQCEVFPFALSDQPGETTFNYVKNAPAFSGIKKRKYDVQDPDVQMLDVKVETLDHIIPSNIKIDFIKIDVEGGEFGVLKGAKNLLQRCKPLLVFECGLGASEFYGTKPEDLFHYLDRDCGYRIFSLQNWLLKKSPFTEEQFIDCFNKNSEYYFVAKNG